jgi:hypothetical protein
MTQTFTHPLYKREVIVDDGGITERRAGVQAIFIPWEQLERLGRSGACSDTRSKISLRLTPRRRTEFFRFASGIWRQRQPERWQRNQERIRRDANRAAYIWLPSFIVGPCIVCYLLLWVLGWPERLRDEIVRLHVLTGLGVVYIGLFWAWYAYRMRKQNAV